MAGLDEAGNEIVALEAERINHDWRAAIPADFDKMAACELEAAIWITVSRTDAHQILETLHEPPDSEPRVPKTDGHTTSPQDFLIDEPGLTDVFTVKYVRDNLLAE